MENVIPDQDEPNDKNAEATYWDLSQGAKQGYFWDIIHGEADYYKFVAPATQDQSGITFEITNPAPNNQIGMRLMNAKGYTLNYVKGQPGAPVSLNYPLVANKIYFLRISSYNHKTSLEPYTLRAIYAPGESTLNERSVRFFGRVQLQNLIPVPLQGVEIYVQVAEKPPVLLDTTDRSGNFEGNVTIAEGQELIAWAVKLNYQFSPRSANWIADAASRSHKFSFKGTEAVVILPTPLPTVESTSTQIPSPKPSPSKSPQPHPQKTQTKTPQPPSSTQSTSIGQASISGHLWRLFPQSQPAGVGAAMINLTVNGAEQSQVISQIDGSYTILLNNLQVGDQLRMTASGQEDQFEPFNYEWQVESGITHWVFDYYSYWGTITPPARDDQNKLYGQLTDSQGKGIPNQYILVQMGTSDAYQIIGPTDAKGYYQGYVRLPWRIMVTVWVESGGFVPSRYQFFHAYASENRQINFTQVSIQK